MVDDLRRKLNARADAERAARADAEEAGSRYKAAVLREYPKLARDLYNRVKAALDGVKDVKIEVANIQQPLTYTEGSTDKGFREGVWGTVEAPVFAVGFGDRKIVFEPAGTNFFGVPGKINVRMTRPNPLVNGGIFMVRSEGGTGDETWKLATLSDSFKPVELTDEALSDLLEHALL